MEFVWVTARSHIEAGAGRGDANAKAELGDCPTDRQLEPAPQPVEIKARITTSKVKKGHAVVEHCLCLFSTLPRSGCAQVQRHCSSSRGRGEAFVFFGRSPSSFVANNNEALQQASSQSCSLGWDRGHPHLPLSPFLNFLVLADAGSIHLYVRKAKPINARNATRSRLATSHQCFCISAKTFHLNFNKVKPINARDAARSRVATYHRFFCISSATLSLPLFRPTSLRVCAGAALRLGGVFVFLDRPPSNFAANNETMQQASAHPCSSGWDSGHPLPPSLPPS
jgi:hypothetical protein